MTIEIPELSLVILVGASGSGKSTFAARHFDRFEIVSSDFCRGLVSNDENNQHVSPQAFELLHSILRHRLSLGYLSVVDATNVRPEDRKQLVQLAREYHVLPVAIVFDIPEQVCHDRNKLREDRNFGPRVIRNQRTAMKRGLRNLKREGFRKIHTFKKVEEVDSASITRAPLWNNRKSEQGPFDIIGDVHGCLNELLALMEQLGYSTQRVTDREDELGWKVTAPDTRKLVFVGDLVDRGPHSVEVLKLVMAMCADGVAQAVPGNHDAKLLKFLQGRKVQLKHGLELTVEQLEPESEVFKKKLIVFLDGLISHHVYDEGKLVVAHAGLKEEMQGRGSGAVRQFCLYGETTGETDEFGLPERINWALDYKGRAMVVYGHTPVPEAEWLNNTMNLDTGCVFGGKLSALRYPEREVLQVEAKETYAESKRPFKDEDGKVLSAQHLHDDSLDLSDVFGKLIISTELQAHVLIREQNSAAALEVMSRFAVNPKWLIYLPPTMSPCETSEQEGYLEHPTEAFADYKAMGVKQVVCEEKHMGSRAVVVLCRDEAVAKKRFGILNEGRGMIYTRTGRRFFDDPVMEAGLLSEIDHAAEQCGFWEALSTDWVCLDTELMPWSAKAQGLLREQYAAVGVAGQVALNGAATKLHEALERTGLPGELLDKVQERQADMDRYIKAYSEYCWPVNSLQDLRLASFHVLATEGQVHHDKPHPWHMDWCTRLSDAGSEVLMKTRFLGVDLEDEASVAAGVDWWLSLTEHGGEGMVIKPRDFITRGSKGLLQPAVKCRGREYLRIIYGPEYAMEHHLKRLRRRGLGKKRSLALREFALGMESLNRFVAGHALRRVHQCVFGVLALESEPVDPRL